MSLKKAVKYLMNNCYFQLGNKVFRQIIGIPMGSDPAPFFANLFLYHLHEKYLRSDWLMSSAYFFYFHCTVQINAVQIKEK